MIHKLCDELTEEMSDVKSQACQQELHSPPPPDIVIDSSE